LGGLINEYRQQAGRIGITVPFRSGARCLRPVWFELSLGEEGGLPEGSPPGLRPPCSRTGGIRWHSIAILGAQVQPVAQMVQILKLQRTNGRPVGDAYRSEQTPVVGPRGRLGGSFVMSNKAESEEVHIIRDLKRGPNLLLYQQDGDPLLFA
jgi:hypothetical protein